MAKELLEHQAREMLSRYGAPVLDFRLARSAGEAASAARELGYPVALKVVSPHIVHKSDAGGVRLGLSSEPEVEHAYGEILSSAARFDPNAHVEGVLVSPFLQGGTELIVGVSRDAQFGPVVMVGLGGVFVEIFKDVSFAVTPVEPWEATEMLENLRAYPLLTGARGRDPVDLEALERLILAVSDLAGQEPVEELDLNPVLCFPDRVLVADARLSLV